jgi:hypothetical protein
MRTRGRDEWSQTLQKLMTLHDNMSRPISPACLESISEASISHRFEATLRKRRPSDITTQTFESAPVVNGNCHIRV